MPTKTSGSCLQLPTEVWERLAQFMSLEEWARLSGTCRTIHSIQLEQIQLAMRGAPPLQWLQKHWGKAKKISLTFESPLGPWPVKRDAAPLAHLRIFQLKVWGDMQSLDLSSIVFLTFFLLQPPTLTHISLDIPISMAVPPLKALKHLILRHGSYDDAASFAIGELRQLQTLRLSGRGGAEVIECAPLQLTGLSQLRNVAIYYMVVREGQVNLPSGCSLHVVGGYPEISSLYWETNARKKELKTLIINEWDELFDSEGTELPYFVSWAGCTYLFWDACNVGRATMPVDFSGPSLQCLTELHINGNFISVHLPVELRLAKLHISAVNLLFACIDAYALAQGVRELSFVYRMLTGHAVPEIAVEMAKMGKQMTPVPAHAFQDDEPDNEGQDQSTRMPWSGIYWGTFYAADSPWPCTCDTCEKCLDF